MLISIDCGHGYATAGKRTCPFPDGRQMREHEFNRDVGFMFGELLTAAGHEIIYCFDDIGISSYSLTKRAEIANRAKADIFISIHANAYGNGIEWNNAHGLVAFYVSTAGEKLARTLLPELANSTDMPINSYQKHRYTVLTKTDMPAVIIECGFMTNYEDAKKLLEFSYRRKCAEGLFNGIQKWCGEEAEDVEVIEVDKMKLGTEKLNCATKDIKHDNFINGMFFSWGDNGLFDMCINNEQYLERQANPTGAKGTFYVYTDGRCGVVQVYALQTKDVKMAIQGVNLLDNIPLRESMDLQGWAELSETEVCRRAAIGFDDGKAKIVVKNCSLLGLQAECKKQGLADNDGCVCAIALDAGGSFCLKLNGEIKYDTTRYMRNIIYW